jgi:hypothetical protein
MQLDLNTISKLEKLKQEAEARIEKNRLEVLKHIIVDQKLQVVVNPDERELIKQILDDSLAASGQIKEYTNLINKIEEVSISLEMGGRDFNSRRSILNSKILQAERQISQGIAQNVISKTRVDELEGTIADARTALGKMSKSLTPLENKLAGIPDAGLISLQHESQTEGF